MKQKVFSIIVIVSVIMSVLITVSPVKAEDPFPSPDADRDGLANDLETAGWYNLAGGPFLTNWRDADSDDDGLTDGEEKLFDTNPLDSHSPGIAAKYDSNFKTRQYFSTTDPAYLSIKQGGDQYLMTEALVLRRGATISIAGPASGTLAITGTSMTILTPIPNPARGGWTVSLPANGTAGTYTATITDGAWTKSLPIYVIFELPSDLSQDQIAAFLYDDDPNNKKDEVAVFWAMQEWQNWFNCPQPNNGICSNWAYHVATGYAQAFWTEQFTKSVFVDHAIKAIHGKTTLASATPSIANWTDTEFRTRSGKMKNSWTSAMNRWNDGTGLTMDGGYCETTSTVFTALLRSAGIAARPFTLDYNKTAGHGESGQIGTGYDYDHATMMWFDGAWRAQRAYNGDEASDLYYPWNHGTTGVSLLDNWRTYSGYYNDYYGDFVVSANAGWDFQNGNNGGGVVNTIWPITPDQRLTANQDYYWKSNWPLQITQSPYVDILNCQLWKGDNWAPSEWSNPPVSNPAGRTAVQSYNLPAGIPDPTAPLENFPYNPRPTACSSSTPTSVCNDFKARWSTLTCTVVSGQGTGMISSAAPNAVNSISSSLYSKDSNNSPYAVLNENGVDLTAIQPKPQIQETAKEAPQLGSILNDLGLDRDGDGRYDDLVIKFEVTSPTEGKYQFGGYLRIGDTSYRLSTTYATLIKGKQTVEINFDGQQIGDNKANGPYKVEALWIAQPDQSILQVVEPDMMLNYQEYKYSTKAFKSNQFKVTAAVFADNYSHQGIDENRNGLYEGVLVNTPIVISLPGKFKVEGDLYDANGEFVDHASWTGEDANAALQFKIKKTTPPYTVQHLMLVNVSGELLDSRYVTSHEIKDFGGRVEGIKVEVDNNGDSTARTKDSSKIGIQKVAVVTPEPGAFTITPVDTNSNGLFDKLIVDVGVTLTETNDTGDYRIEALLEDDYGTEVAWTVSGNKHLIYGVTGQTMRLEFDGKILYDQLPLTGNSAFKLVAVKIFSGNLSPTTFESEVKYAVTTPAYSRGQFEPSSPAVTVFQDDLESGAGKWTSSSPWGIGTDIWQSHANAWKASATGSTAGSIKLASALDLRDYAGPVLSFSNAHQMNNGSGKVEVSTDGINWTTLKTFTGSTPHWIIEQVDLSAYAKTNNVSLRFNAQSTNGLAWYVDDVYVNAWPAVKSASFTYPTPIVAGADTTFTASYASINTTLPMQYKWNFCGVERQVTTPDIMYRFPEAGDCLVTLTVQNPYDSAIAPPQTIYVAPSGNQFILNVDISPSGGGTVTKNPDRPAYNPGETVTLTATPATGHTWGGWSGACSGTAPCVVTMDANKVVTANFTPIEYTLTTSTTGSGTVAKSPDKPTYHYGEVVQLTAVPDTHWSFASWSGDLSGTTNPQSITIDGNKVVNVTFVQSDFTLTATTVGNGTVAKNPDHAYYPIGESVTLTATPAQGWSFDSWSGDLSGSNNPTSMIMSASKSVTATFTQNHYTLTTNVVGQGTVSKSPDQATYIYGDQVTLTPIAETGWSFSAWSGACTGSGACVVTMNGNTTVTATFTENHYTLSVTPVGQGTVAKSPDLAAYTHGQAVTLTATPATGWKFTGWSGDVTSTENPLTVTMNGNKAITATFTRIEYTLEVIVVGHGQATRDIDGPYYYGDIVQLTALPSSGWSFGGWSGDLSGSTTPASITIDGNKSVTATFTEDWYTLTVLMDGNGRVEVNPPGPYRYHSMPLLTAYPDTGWTFSNWTGDRTGTANPIEVTVNYNSTVTAHFTAIPYTFTTSIVGQGTLTKSPEKSTYIYGDQVTVTATPAEGWSFDHWSGSCTGNGPCVVTVDGNESIEATFMAGAHTLDVTKVGNGTVTKNPDQPTYVTGATVTLAAAADPGWEFTGWSGDVTSADNPLTITMDGNKAITATFTQLEFQLTINQATGGTITIDPAGPYTYGALVTLTATPEPGYNFMQWGGDASGITTQTTITMDSDKTVTASFTPVACYAPRLIAAIEAANAEPDATTINLDADCSYTLTTSYAVDPDGYGPVGLPPITTPVTLLVGSNTTITRGGTAAFRFFYVTTTGSLTLENVTLSNGLAQGGNGGHAQYDGGGGAGGMGGAIFNRGALTLTNVTLTGNTALGGNGGNDNTVVTPADAGGGGMGGHGQNAPGNNLGGAGGGINGGAGGISGSNSGKPGGNGGGGGGAAYAGGHGLGGNGGFGGGGGGGSTGGTGGFGGGGGGGQDAPRGGTPGFGAGRGQAWVGGGGAGFGGAVFNDGGTLTITDSTFISNTAQGGNGTVGTGGNNPTGTGGGGSGYGGAVFNRQGTLNITGPIYTDNTVIAGTGGVAGLAVAADVYHYVEYTLTVNTSGNGSVTRSSAGPYYNMDQVTLTATPATGYTFTGWSGDLTGTTSPASITMDGNKTVTATFTPVEYTLSVTASTGGSVTKNPDQATYHSGDVVQLTAVPETGYYFSGWTGALTGTTNPASLTITGDMSVTAAFSNQYTLAVNVVGNGTVTKNPDQTTYAYDTQVLLTPTADAGYTFTGWEGGGCEGTDPCTVTLTANTTVTATFTQDAFTLTVVSDHGPVTKDPNRPTYAYGTSVLLTMGTVEAGWSFTGWSGGECTGTDPCTVTMTADTTVTANFTQNTYTLAIDPLTGGMINAAPEGPYHYGDEVTVEAVPDENYTFTGWTGDLSGTINPTTIIMSNDKTIGATFDVNVVTLTIQQATGGTITAVPAAPYHYGDDVTLTATADTGYTFTGWTGDASGSTSPITITLNGDKAVSATFELNAVTLTLNQATGGAITADPAGPYHYGDEVTLTAMANTGYTFIGWTEDLSGETTNPFVLTLDEDKTVGTTFELKTVTLSINQSTGGMITAAPEGPYQYGDEVTLTATADPGYSFTGWTGDASGTTSPVKITLDGDKTVGANFELGVVTLTIKQSTGGTITATPSGPYHYGDIITVEATANTGFTFAGWTDDLSGTISPSTITLDSDKTIGATFEANVVTLTIEPPVGGTITAVPASPYHYGDMVKLTAVADTGYGFTSWTGACSTEMTSTCMLVLNGDKTVGASFAQNVVTLTINQSAGGTITAGPEGPYHYGDEVTLTAIADTGYSFIGWTGDVSGITNPITITMDGNKTISATFEANAVTLTITQSTGGTISATPSGPYHYGQEVTLTATPDTGYSFTSWTGDASGPTSLTTITLNGDKTVGATFELNMVILTINQTIGGIITAEPTGTYHYGDIVNLRATANPGYTFTGWTGDLSGTTNPTTITLNGDKIVSATFEQLPNTEPILNAIGNQEAKASNSLTFTSTAIDSDVPAQTLIFSLDAGAPNGASINATTGVFTWTPTATQAPQSYSVTVRVTDNGTPALSDTETITITVTDWSENWDSYPDGTQMHGVNGWTGWYDNPAAGAPVSSAQSRSAPQSIQIQGATDLVHTYTGYASGKWLYIAWQYVPSDTSSQPYFIMMNTYPNTDNGSWSVQAKFDPASGIVSNDMQTGGTPLQLVKGRWVKIALEIDLDSDHQRFYYDGNLLYEASWTTSPLGTGSKNIGAIDLFANNSSPIYYDDLSLTRAQTLITTVEGSGTITRSPNQSSYAFGEEVTLTAAPAVGWSFDNWNGACSGSGPCVVTMDGDKSVTATFTQNPVTLTINQSTGGTIVAAPAGPYHYGDEVTLTATADEGYGFTGWTGDASGSTSPITIMLNGDKTVGATFELNVVTLTLNQAIGGTITVDPAAPYDYGDTVQLTATPDTGYTFTGWTGDASGTNNPVTIVLNGNKSVGATFTPIPPTCYALTLDHTGEGSDPAASPANSTGCTEGSYVAGEVITLSGPVPTAGYEISGWTGTADDTSKATTNTVTMPAVDHTVKVNYIQVEYVVTVTAGAGGSVSKTPDQPSYHLGDKITIAATNDAGYTFAGWTGDYTDSTSPVEITVSGNMDIAANFTQDTYTLIVEAVNGSVTIAPDKSTYTHGEHVVLTATPADGYSFTGWTGDLVSEANPATITMDGNKSVTANFTLIPPSCYALTLTHTGQGSDPMASPANSAGCGAGEYLAGEAITLSATPDTGWKVSGWTGTTNDGSTEATNTVIMPASGHEAVVTYAKIQFTLTVTQADGGTITPTTAVYDSGTVVTLTATPAEGHHFVVWTDACAGQSGTSCSVTMDIDKAVSATFAHDTYTLTVNQPTGGAIAPPTADYEYGSVVELTATPLDGYHFVAWTGACSAQTGLICNLTITSNLTVSATFEQTPVCYALTLGHTGEGSDPVATPTKSAGCAEGTYLVGETIMLSEAAPAIGSEISGWTGTTDDTSKANTNTLTMPANEHSVAVNYTQTEYTLTVTSAHGIVDVSGSAPYHYNDTVTITMGEVQPGWTFAGWSGAGCTGTTPCTITITGNTEVSANFTETEYALNITQSTGGEITAEPGGPYHLGDPVTLTATAVLGYTFSSWTGDCSSETSATCTLTMDAAKSVSATFTQNHYTLEVISAHGPVSKVPDQTDYTYNQTVLLTMGPVEAGWTFAGWSGGECSGTDPCTVTITSDTTVTAEFSQVDYSLDVAVDPVDSGNSVTLSNPGPNYHYGDLVTLTPVAAAGWQFDHWDGAVQDNKVTITGNMVVTAYFTRIEYTLEMIANPSTGGSIAADKPSPYYLNDVVTLTATPAPGYTFTRWEGACTGSTECVVAITENTSVTAVFTPIEYSLNVTKQGNGTVSPDKQPPYHYGDVVTLTATADPGWTFTGWDGACTGNGDCQVTMDGDKAVTATFTEDKYILDININGSGTVSKVPDQSTYAYGDVVTLTATPASGWEVSEWSVEGCTGTSCTVTMYGDQNVIVTFTQYIEYTLTTSVDPPDSGTIIADPGGPAYPRDTMVRLTVNPGPGYFFDHWTGDCAGQGNPCTVTMNGDKTATAYLAQGKGLPKNLITSAGTLREGFESMSGWTVSGSGSGYGAVQDTVNKKEGTASIKLTTPASGNVTITKNVVWDLSADQGNIRFWVYDSGASEPSGGSIILYTNASSYYTASYGGAFKLRYKPGWNLISLRTSDWKATGSPSWANITSIRIRLDSRSVNTYSFDELTSGVVAQPAVIFTFDKGLTSLYTQAFNYMSSRNVRGTGYVTTDLVSTTGYARWDQLQAMKAAGWTIGNQTKSATDLTALDLAGQTAQLQGAIDTLTANSLDPLHIAYPGGKYNANTLTAMSNLHIYTGRSLLTFNNVSPLGSPYEIAQRQIGKTTTLSTAQGWVDTAKSRQEILVITLQGLSASPATTDWYIARFQSLVNYCISQGMPIITMDDLYNLQSGDITIPEAK